VIIQGRTKFTSKLYPATDSTTAIQINKADGVTVVLNVDTTDARIGLGTTAPTHKLEIVDASEAASGNGLDGIVKLATGTGAQTDEQLNIGIVDGATGYSWLQAVKPSTNVRALILQPLGGSVGIGTTNTTGDIGTLILPSPRASKTGLYLIDDGTNTALCFLHCFAPTGADGANVFVGPVAGNFTMSPGGGASSLASYNAGVGENALADLTTGYWNAGLGCSALHANTTGHDNTAVGGAALSANLTGHGNTVIGCGSAAGLLSGDHNILIGDSVAGTLATGSNNIVIGSGSDALSAAMADTVILGNSTSAVTILKGDVGIGATSPKAKLEVVKTSSGVITYPLRLTNLADAANTGVCIEFNLANGDFVNARIGASRSNQVSAGDADLIFQTRGAGNLLENMRINAIGNVGIGVTVPTAYLHLKAGTATANTAPLKIDPGVLNTQAVSGCIESDGTHLYWTDSSNVRHQLDA
jgi:hypothetical protein